MLPNSLCLKESPGFVGFKNSALGKTKMCLFTSKEACPAGERRADPW